MESLGRAAALRGEADSVKLLKIVLKNFGNEPAKAKFRRINMAGSAGQKLLASAECLALMKEVGFVEAQSDDGSFFVVDESRAAYARTALLAMEVPKVVPEEKLSMKAQARRDADRRKKLELETARKHREEVKKQIERDNRARKEDPNWKPGNGVSKGGKDINTFRGKYGEDKGG